MSIIRVDEETSSPTTPASGKGLFFFKNDKIPYAKSSTGAEYDLTAAAGARWLALSVSDATTDLTTGAGKDTIFLPYAATLNSVFASVITPATGASLIFDINEAGVSVLSTKLSIDVTENTSGTAATPPVISDSALAQYAAISFDIDQVGSGTAGAGAKIWINITPV